VCGARRIRLEAQAWHRRQTRGRRGRSVARQRTCSAVRRAVAENRLSRGCLALRGVEHSSADCYRVMLPASIN
jgi:hypothetical protein